MAKIETTLLDKENRTPAVIIKKDGIVHLFDCGRVIFPRKHVSKLENIFISHTHIDHMVGFDEVMAMKLYASIKHLNIFGPENISRQIMHRINSYTWNLVGPEALTLDVFEIKEQKIEQTAFSINGNMEGKRVKTYPIEDDIILLHNDYIVRRIELNHGIPSMGYSFEETPGINISKEMIEEREFRPGPWISRIKQAYASNEDVEILVGEDKFRSTELFDMLTETRGAKIVYVTDFLFDDKTRSILPPFAKDADVLYCEASYKNEELELAQRNMHLTEGQAEEIARLSNAKQLVKFHFSDRYDEEDENSNT